MHRLISDKLVRLVENNTNIIIEKWTESILLNPETSTYAKEHSDYITDNAKVILNSLGKWIHYDTTKETIGKKYTNMGREIFGLGIPLCEAVRSLVSLRRIIWLYVVDESAFDSAFQLHQMKEFNDRVILFFDRAQYFIIKGYTNELNVKVKKIWDKTDRDTEQIFFYESFYGKDSK